MHSSRRSLKKQKQQLSSILWQYLLPSRSPEFIARHEAYVQTGSQIQQDLQDERRHILQLLEEVNEKRKNKYRSVQSSSSSPASKLESQSSFPTSEAEVYTRLLVTHSTLRSRLDCIDTCLEEISDKFRTSACHEDTGFYGLTDWAKQALEVYEHLCDGIGGASVFGAGITYTTIFSGTRGNIGLMCWAFALFNVGFVIAAVVRSILTWLSRLPLPNKTFATTFFWELVIQFALIIAFACTTMAIFLLNLTIYQFSSADAEVQLNLSSKPSGIIAMTVLVGAVSAVTICIFLSWWSNDFKPPQRQQRRRKQKTEDLYV